jgi:hypothetical protein
MDIQQRIELIKTKLEKVKAKDTRLEVFGAGDNPWYNMEGHHYILNPPLAEEEIEKTEKYLDIEFPEEYREFLKWAGNGGAGPAWGLYKLYSTYADEEFMKEYPDFCSMDFPYENSFAEDVYKVLKEDYYHRVEMDDPFGGFIKLANYGHDMSAILIVSGEQRGKMWLLDEGTTITPFFQDDKGRGHGVSFLDWYENWLDEQLDPNARPTQF